MRIPAIVLCVILVSGCTAMKSVEAPPQEVRELIVAGSLIAPGDKIKVRTSDGVTHQLTVSAVTNTRVIGASDQIMIADIESIDKSEFSGEKTVGLIGGGVAAVAGGIILALGLIAASL